jgi:hypothetical protein
MYTADWTAWRKTGSVSSYHNLLLGSQLSHRAEVADWKITRFNCNHWTTKRGLKGKQWQKHKESRVKWVHYHSVRNMVDENKSWDANADGGNETCEIYILPALTMKINPLKCGCGSILSGSRSSSAFQGIVGMPSSSVSKKKKKAVKTSCFPVMAYSSTLKEVAVRFSEASVNLY